MAWHHDTESWYFQAMRETKADFEWHGSWRSIDTYFTYAENEVAPFLEFNQDMFADTGNLYYEDVANELTEMLAALRAHRVALKAEWDVWELHESGKLLAGEVKNLTISMVETQAADPYTYTLTVDRARQAIQELPAAAPTPRSAHRWPRWISNSRRGR
jgi:hypothetical protein